MRVGRRRRIMVAGVVVVAVLAAGLGAPASAVGTMGSGRALALASSGFSDRRLPLVHAPAVVPDVPETRGLRVPRVAAAGPGNVVTVDLMVAYTPAALQASGGQPRLLEKIDAAVAETNLAYTRSGVYISLRLVHTLRVDYRESGDSNRDLEDLTGTNDGHVDGIHEVRDDYGADVVALVVTNSDFGGIAWQLTADFFNTPWWDEWAFALLAERWLGDSEDFGSYSIGELALVHELGHIMGAGHEAGSEYGDDGLFPFSHAHCFSTGEGTIMGASCWPRLGFFSNPNRTIPRTRADYAPLPSVPSGPLGIPGGADNARTLNLTAGFVAGLRPEREPSCWGETATVVGTEHADDLRGTAGRDVIAGLGGNDVIRGGGGNDLICGGEGDDTISGESGNDQVQAGPGNDRVVGGLGSDVLWGGAGADTIQGSAGNDRLFGEAGDDSLDGNLGADTVNGGQGRDTCLGETKAACESAAPGGLDYSSGTIHREVSDRVEATSDITVTGVGAVGDLNLGLVITHTWVGDLRVILTHVDTGSSVTIVDRPGSAGRPDDFGCGYDDIDATLDDEASTSVEGQCRSTRPAIYGPVRPTNPLSAFDGEDRAGTWRLRVLDEATEDDGFLESWALQFQA